MEILSSDISAYVSRRQTKLVMNTWHGCKYGTMKKEILAHEVEIQLITPCSLTLQQL